MLLQHLITAEDADYVPTPESENKNFTPLEKLSPGETLNAKIGTTNFLENICEADEHTINEASETRAIEAFGAFISNSPDAKQKILDLQLPEEVRSSVAMLSEYQWKFVQQAEELRSMAVAKIVKETDHPDARIRLKALDMLGKVTEVALFTERLEVKQAEMSDDELEKRIKEKLGKYMGKADVVDVEDISLPGPDEEETDANPQ